MSTRLDPQWMGALAALVADRDAGLSRHEAGTCIYCHTSAEEEYEGDLDELSDEEIDALPKHTEDCPIVRGRALLGDRA